MTFNSPVTININMYFDEKKAKEIINEIKSDVKASSDTDIDRIAKELTIRIKEECINLCLI